VNNQIIGTSTYWRFDFFTGVLLAALTLPLNYLLTITFGFTGPAIADLLTFSIYNAIRWFFLWRKFHMQPFTRETVYTLLLGAAVWWVCQSLFGRYSGILWMMIRSLVFVGLYGAGVLGLRLSTDIRPVWETVKKRLRLSGRRAG
jgi:hypothetical protein